MPKKILIAILFLAVLLRVITAFYLGNMVQYLPSIADQVSYNTLANRLLDGHGFTFASDWWPATRAGEPTAHWSYLYVTYLGLVYKVFGVNPIAARLIQAVLAGILMPWLAYRLAKRAFPTGFVQPPSGKQRWTVFARLNYFWLQSQDAIPLLAAGWVAIYGYFIYFSAALMTETFYFISIMWTFDCAFRIQAQLSSEERFKTQKFSVRSSLAWIELGAAIGITAMLRQVFLPFVPFLFTWLFWIAYRHTRLNPSSFGACLRDGFLSILPGSIVSGAVIILLIAPITLFNYSRFDSFVLLNTNAGYAFYWSNHPIYGTDYVSILTEEMPDYYELLPEDVLWMDEAALDRELLRQALGFIAADPLRYALLSIDRIPAYFLFWPLPSSSIFSNITRVLSYGLALPFILFGIGLWIRDLNLLKKYTAARSNTKELEPELRANIDVLEQSEMVKQPDNLMSINRAARVGFEAGLLLVLFALVYSLIHLLSWAGVRYRLPIDAVSLVFAARGLYALGGSILFQKS